MPDIRPVLKKLQARLPAGVQDLTRENWTFIDLTALFIMPLLIYTPYRERAAGLAGQLRRLSRKLRRPNLF